MASTTIQDDALLAAVSSTSTCTIAAVASLKDLLLSKDPHTTSSATASKPQTAKATRPARINTNGSTKIAGSAKAKKGEQDGYGELSEKEKASLATRVINATLKSLGEAAKAPSAPPSKISTPAAELARASARTALRRSSSSPMTPLCPRPLNRTSTSPIVTTKTTRAPPPPSISAGCLAAVECARVAFSALRTLQGVGGIALPELHLEAGMSSFVGKLIGLGMFDQAVKELRVLKRQLEGPLAPTKPTPTRVASTESHPSSRGISDLLDFHHVATSGQVLALIAMTQLQTLRILAAWKKPSHIEAAVPFLRSSRKTSPLNILLESARGDSTDKEKAARQLEVLSQLLFSFAPSVVPEEDETALEARLSVSPAVALEIQRLGLEARLQRWILTSYHGDVDKEVLGPLSRCLSAYVRRVRSQGVTSYTLCRGTFDAIHGLLELGGFAPRHSSRSPLAALYQTLETLGRESGRLGEAISWAARLRSMLDLQKDSAAKCCSMSAQLLSLHLREPEKYHDGDELLAEVVNGIQASMRGDTNELEELLANVCLVRKSAMNLLVVRSNTVPSQCRVRVSTKQLLETFVCQCPRFCLRWLGKPPASKSSSTKDFLRYEQRRQLLTKHISLVLDSALMVTKTLIEEGRVDWNTTDAGLADCLTLLEYLDDAKLSGPSTSYHVKISHFYYLNYRALKDDSAVADGAKAMEALRRSIDCIKYRSSEEKEKSQLIWKLERMADICRAQGRTAEALGALQSVRTSLVDDGALEVVAEALASRPPLLAWSSDDRAEALSRTLVAIAKLEHVHIDWTLDMSEAERAAVLEHRLHFVLVGATASQEDVTLAHPCIDSLLRIYYPTRFPVRRLRTLLHLLSINIDKPDTLADIRPQVNAAMGLIERKDLGEDVSLGEYLRYYQPLYISLVGLSEGYPNLDDLTRCLSDWQRLLTSESAKEDLDKSIDNTADFLRHLQSIADFARTMGEDAILTAALELSAKVTKALSWPGQDEHLKYDSYLASQYVNTGDYANAERILERSRVYIGEQPDTSVECLANFHLASAEYAVATGSFDQA